jgi:hypothetical protein
LGAPVVQELKAQELIFLEWSQARERFPPEFSFNGQKLVEFTYKLGKKARPLADEAKTYDCVMLVLENNM